MKIITAHSVPQLSNIGETRRTIGSVLRAYGGFGPGFDTMRLVLAVSVIGWHCVLTARGTLASAQATPFWSVDYFVVPMFFVLSGFLTAGSGTRLSVKNFLLNRAARILPALAVAVLATALVLGPLFTTLGPGAYFSDRDFWAYLLTMVGFVQYDLPGLFVQNPVHMVNFSLWSVPYELGCYGILATLIAAGFLRAPSRLLMVTGALMLLAVAAEASGLREHAQPAIRRMLSFSLLNGSAKVFPCFLLGVAIHQWRDRIPFDWRLFAVSVGVCLTIAVVGDVRLIEAPVVNLIGLPALAYTVVYLGLIELPRLPLFRHGDYSYGIYLFHAPILQSILVVLPGVEPLPLFICGLPVITGAAALSWHYAEKPALMLRKKFSISAAAHGFGSIAPVAPSSERQPERGAMAFKP